MSKTSKVGITAVGAYIPYYYIERDVIGSAWGTKGMKGRRSMANSDEDSLTMSVEAGRDCLRTVPRKSITHHFNATTTSPYGEKSGAALISTACDLEPNVLSVDFNSSIRGGAAALRLALDTAAANADASILVTAADTRNAAPKSNEEQLFGDAGAALVVGTGSPIAVLMGSASVDNEIHDFWRNDGENKINTTEQRFAIDEGYLRSMPVAIAAAMKDAGVEAKQVAKLVVNSPGLKEYGKLAKKCGFAPEQVQEPLMLEVGNCGAAHTLLVLASALETAKAGDILVVADYGTGATAFVFQVTDEVKACGPVVSKFFERRKAFNEYARFLSFRGLVTPKQGEPFKIPAAPAITWREQNTYLRLHASTCTKCGSKTFPPSHVCYECRSIDTFTVESQTECKSKLYSFSVDRLAGRSDDPLIVQAIADDDKGVRIYMNMTDVEESEVKIGMDLEFTFRKIHNLADLPNYYWKFRPIRTK